MDIIETAAAILLGYYCDIGTFTKQFLYKGAIDYKEDFIECIDFLLLLLLSED